MASLLEHSALLAVITGPTAAGKGSVAHELALTVEAEVVSMDSMKVYREMDVGTAKPSLERRREVPYHLIDVVDPDEEFSVGDYEARLGATLESLRGRGRRAILVGGTPLYLKALVYGFRSGPSADWSIRESLIEEARRVGAEVLHQRLSQRDSVAASKIHPRDLRRIVRALEFVETTGQRISDAWDWDRARESPPETRAPIFGLQWDRKTLYRRIDRRVDAMVDAGLFREARRLQERMPPLGRSASQCIGYKEVWAGWETDRSQSESVAAVQQSTRRFAKHQLTWFRRLPIEWIPVTEDTTARDVTREITGRLGL